MYLFYTIIYTLILKYNMIKIILCTESIIMLEDTSKVVRNKDNLRFEI